MKALANEILPLKPWYLQCNDYLIIISIALASFIYPVAVNAYAKLLKQKVFKALWWYANSGAWRSYSISPFFFRIPNMKSKYRICYSRSTINIGLKQPFVKLRFSCTDIFFNPLYIKMEPMLQSCRLSLKQLFSFMLFSGFFLLNHNFTTNPHHLCI